MQHKSVRKSKEAFLTRIVFVKCMSTEALTTTAAMFKPSLKSDKTQQKCPVTKPLTAADPAPEHEASMNASFTRSAVASRIHRGRVHCSTSGWCRAAITSSWSVERYPPSARTSTTATRTDCASGAAMLDRLTTTPVCWHTLQHEGGGAGPGAPCPC